LVDVETGIMSGFMGRIEQLGKFDDLTLEEKTIRRVKAGYYFLTEYRLRSH